MIFTLSGLYNLSQLTPNRDWKFYTYKLFRGTFLEKSGLRYFIVTFAGVVFLAFTLASPSTEQSMEIQTRYCAGTHLFAPPVHISGSAPARLSAGACESWSKPPPPSFPFPPLPFLPSTLLRSRPLKSSYGYGSVVSSLARSGRSPSRSRIWWYLAWKYGIWWQQFW